MNNEITKDDVERILYQAIQWQEGEPIAVHCLIADLKAVAQAYLQEREWISVEERLPKNEDYVAVITTEHPNPVTGWYIKDEGWIVSKGEFDSIGEGFFSDESIKYWLSLPPAPEQ